MGTLSPQSGAKRSAAGERADDHDRNPRHPTIRRRRDRLDAWGDAARRLLPDGEVSDFLTRVYKRVRPVGVIGGPGPDEATAMIALREYFAPYNTELAERYGVDVSPWMPALVEHVR